VLFAFDTGDIATGTPCAVATRLPAADWRLGEPEMASRETTFPVLRPPAYDPSDGPLEAALLCFDPPPGPLPETLEMLADAGPSIVFVAPLLSAGGPTGSEQRSGARARRGA